MKEIQLYGIEGKGKVALIDDNDFELVSQHRWHFGSRYVRSCQYLGGGRKGQKSKMLLLQKFIMNTPDGFVTDHINGDVLDNRRINLRICTNTENIRKSKKRKNNTSGYVGVHWAKYRNKWAAHITFNRKAILIGRFDLKEDAARAYDRKAKELFGEFARLNFPEIV